MSFDTGALVGRIRLDMSGWTGNVRTAIADASRVNAGLGSLATGSRGVTAALATTTAGLGSLSSRLQANIGPLRSVVGLLGGLSAGMLGRSFIQAAAETEQFRIVFEKTLGSVEEGNKVFESNTEYAKRVAHEFRDVMGASVALASVLKGGREQMQAWLPIWGDIAAYAQNLGVSAQETTGQLIRMLAAGAASADLFREKAITPMLGFTPGQQYSPKETGKMLVAAWVDVNSKFRGMAEAMGQTWTGQLSMMADSWFLFRKAIMNKGPFEALTNALKAINAAIEQHFEALIGLTLQYGPLALKIAAVVAGVVTFRVAVAAASFVLLPFVKGIEALSRAMLFLSTSQAFAGAVQWITSYRTATVATTTAVSALNAQLGMQAVATTVASARVGVLAQAMGGLRLFVGGLGRVLAAPFVLLRAATMAALNPVGTIRSAMAAIPAAATAASAAMVRLRVAIAGVGNTALVAWAKALVPVTAVIAAIAAIGAAVYALRAAWKQNMYGIQQTVKEFGGWMHGAWSTIVGWVETASERISGAFGGALAWMKERATDWANTVAGRLMAPMYAFEEYMRTKSLGAATSAFLNAGKVNWVGIFSADFEQGKDYIVSKTKTLGSEIAEAIKSSTAGSRDFFSDYGDAVAAQLAEDSGVMGRITDAIKGAIGKGLNASDLEAAGNQALQDIDWDKMLEGFGTGKTGSDAAGKAKQALADLGEEGRKLYESLNVAVGVVARLKEQIAALTASGHWTPETTSLLAAETWESIANQSRETIAAIIAGASALDETLGRELDALREKALQAQASDIIAEIRPETLQSLDDLSEKLRTIVDAGRMTGHVPEWLTAKYWDVLSENIEEAKAKFPEMAAAIEDMRARLDASAGKSLFEDMLGTTALNEAMAQLDQIAVHLQSAVAAGELSGDQSNLLGAAFWDRWRNMAPAAVQELINKLGEIDPLAASAAEKLRASTDLTGRMSEMADKIGQIGNALAQLGPEYQDVAEAATFAGYAIKFMIDVATGNWVSAAIDGIAMLASGMKMFGDETEEVSKGFDRVMEEISSSWASWADRLTDTLVEFIKTGKASFKDFVDSVLEDMLRITIRYGIIAPILDVVGINTYAKGAAFEAGNVIPFAKGGAVVNAPTLFPMAGGKTGIMGEAGAEAIMPLKRLPDGKLGVSASGDQPPVVVNVIDQRTQDSPPVQVRETRGVDGSRQIEVLVRDAWKSSYARGDFDGIMGRAHGLVRKGS